MHLSVVFSEKKQQDIKLKYLTEMGIEELISEEFANNPAAQQTQAFVEELVTKIDEVKRHKGNGVC